jgi:hypothetical protein
MGLLPQVVGSQQQPPPDKDSNKGMVSFGDPQEPLDWERVIAHSSECKYLSFIQNLV